MYVACEDQVHAALIVSDKCYNF